MFKFIALSCLFVGSLAYDVAKHQEHSHRLVHVNAPAPAHYDVPIPYVTTQEHSEIKTKQISVHQPAAYQQLEYSAVDHPEAHVQYVHAVEEPEYAHVPAPNYVAAHEQVQIAHPQHVQEHQQYEHNQQHYEHSQQHYAHDHQHEGHSNPQDAHAEINSSETLVKSNGEYAYGFDTTNGIAKKEHGIAGHSVKGTSQHYTPEGELVTLKYVADENGFHAEGSHIPTPPPLPQHVIETLAWNAAHPEEEEEDHSYDHEDYHHHGHHEHDHHHHDHHHSHQDYHHEHQDYHHEHQDYHHEHQDYHHQPHYTHSDY